MMGRMRTTAEILKRIEDVAHRDRPEGFERSRLLDALPYSDAQRMLAPGSYTEEQWSARRLCDEERLLDAARGMIEAAWERANARRGPSVLRYVRCLRGIAWLLGDRVPSEVAAMIEDPVVSCDYYGKPALAKLADAVGFDWRAVDDDKWARSADDEGVPADEVLGG